MEKEMEKKLPFLDICINYSQDRVITSVYREKTFTGLLINFFSFTSFSYKTAGLIRTLVGRVSKINNT